MFYCREDPGVTLVKASDIHENGDAALNNVENFAKELCSRFDSAKKEPRNRFHTHKSLNTTIKDFIQNKEPKIVSGSFENVKEAKLLSLKESLVIQQQQKEHLKVCIETNHIFSFNLCKMIVGNHIPWSSPG